MHYSKVHRRTAEMGRSWVDLHNGIASMRLSGMGIGTTRSSCKPVALTSASNCFAVRSRPPPVNIIIVRSARALLCASGLASTRSGIARSIISSLAFGPMERRQERSTSMARGSSQSWMTRARRYRSPPGGTEVNMSPPTISQRSATPSVTSNPKAFSTTRGNRHTWATWHYAKNRDLLALQKLGGWKTLSMVTRYAHVNVGELAHTINNLPWDAGETGGNLGDTASAQEKTA